MLELLVIEIKCVWSISTLMLKITVEQTFYIGYGYIKCKVLETKALG